MAKPAYRRVIVKVSGEALSGPEGFGIHQPTIDRIAKDLIAARKLGVRIGVVVGGGNILRGVKISGKGLSRPTADSMGMLATVMNALVLEAAIERLGASARTMSALAMPQVCETYSVRGRYGISTKIASSCSPAAPETRISPPTPPLCFAPPKWTATPC